MNLLFWGRSQDLPLFLGKGLQPQEQAVIFIQGMEKAGFSAFHTVRMRPYLPGRRVVFHRSPTALKSNLPGVFPGNIRVIGSLCLSQEEPAHVPILPELVEKLLDQEYLAKIAPETGKNTEDSNKKGSDGHVSL